MEVGETTAVGGAACALERSLAAVISGTEWWIEVSPGPVNMTASPPYVTLDAVLRSALLSAAPSLPTSATDWEAKLGTNLGSGFTAAMADPPAIVVEELRGPWAASGGSASMQITSPMQLVTDYRCCLVFRLSGSCI